MNNIHSFSFKRKYRIKKRNDFINVLKNGKIVKSKLYICRYLKNSLDYSRIGIIISKKVCNSVKRNYEKRILREFFRQNKDKLIKNFDLIFTVLQSDVDFDRKKIDFEKTTEFIQKNEG